jgi:uncharacterized HAD superfamily protein
MSNIGIDLDDVLVEFMAAYSKICYELFGKPEPGVLPVDWEWTNFDLTKEQMKEAWEAVAKTYKFWEKLDYEPGVNPGRVRRLEEDHNLFFITARVPSLGGTIKDQSCNWLRNMIGLDNPIVLPSYDKGPLASALKLDYFIDDRPKNVLEIKRALPYCKVFIKDSSHNQPFVHSEIHRVKDMNEFIDIVEKETSGLAPSLVVS